MLLPITADEFDSMAFSSGEDWGWRGLNVYIHGRLILLYGYNPLTARMPSTYEKSFWYAVHPSQILDDVYELVIGFAHVNPP